MDFAQFTNTCNRTWSKSELQAKQTINRITKAMNLVHATDGLCTEAGEIKDIIKANIFYGRPINPTHVLEELGDVLYYFAMSIQEFNKFNGTNITLEDIMEANKRKLMARYPQGFDENLANTRNTTNEYKAMEDKQ